MDIKLIMHIHMYHFSRVQITLGRYKNFEPYSYYFLLVLNFTRLFIVISVRFGFHLLIDAVSFMIFSYGSPSEGKSKVKCIFS